MFSGGIGWFICLFVALAAARHYSEPISILGSDSGDAVNRVRTGNPEWSVIESENKLEEMAGNRRLVVDRTYLAARNAPVSAMLQRRAVYTSNGQGAVPDVEDPILRQLMAYIHTLQTPQLPQMAPQSFPATHTYSEPILKTECEEHQESVQLSVETAVATALRAMKHSCNNAKEAAVDFMKDHLPKVLSSRGWAHAVLNQPEEVVLLCRLLSKELEATSPMAALPHSVSLYRKTAITQPTQPDNGNSEHSETRTSTAPPVPTCPTSRLNDDDVSFYRSLCQEEKDKRLINAAQQGDIEEVRTLLAAGAFPGKRDMQGRTALQWAAWNGYLEAASCLLEAGADLEAVDNEGYRPLHRAAMGGHPAMVWLLASAGADLDPQDVWGWTPLHLTVREHRPEAALALLEMGADRNVRNKSGFTPLDMARESNNQPLIDVLTQS